MLLILAKRGGMRKCPALVVAILLLGTLASGQTRTVTGKVTDKAGAPLSGAIVYLQDTGTLRVRTFITDNEGNYRFNFLSKNVEYQIRAQYQGKSTIKTLSAFDSRGEIVLYLKIDMAKKR